ncbi:MAG: AraC family transcriptional regulator [Acidobacteriota bacterium]
MPTASTTSLPEIKEAAALVEDAMVDRDAITHAPRPGLAFWRLTDVRPALPAIYHPSFCIVLQGAKCAHLHGAPQVYDPGHYLLSTITLPVESEVLAASAARPLLGLVIELDFTCLGRLLVELGDAELPHAGPPSALRINPIDVSFARTLLRFLRVAQSDVAWQLLADGLRRELHYHVLAGSNGHIVRDRVERNGKMAQVARAIRFVEDHYDQPLGVDAIARHAGMSASVLHARFKETTGQSPMQFVKKLRLHRASALLVAGASVTQAAYAVGYGSASQFSREYKRLFQTPPSAARAAAATPTSVSA